jgi:hypothetical protein
MVTLLLMFALVKDGLLALFMEILVSMIRTVLEGQLKQMILYLKRILRKSTRNLGIQLNCSFNTVLNRLRALGKENLKKTTLLIV